MVSEGTGMGRRKTKAERLAEEKAARRAIKGKFGGPEPNPSGPRIGEPGNPLTERIVGMDLGPVEGEVDVWGMQLGDMLHVWRRPMGEDRTVGQKACRELLKANPAVFMEQMRKIAAGAAGDAGGAGVDGGTDRALGVYERLLGVLELGEGVARGTGGVLEDWCI